MDTQYLPYLLAFLFFLFFVFSFLSFRIPGRNPSGNPGIRNPESESRIPPGSQAGRHRKLSGTRRAGGRALPESCTREKREKREKRERKKGEREKEKL